MTHQEPKPQQTEEALRQREERLRLTLEAAEVIAWEVDAEGRHYEAGPVGRLFGRPEGYRHSTLDQVLEDILPEDQERVRSCIQTAWQSTGNCRFQYRVPQTDGSMRWLEVCCRLLRDPAGQPQRLLGTARDITEQKHSEEVVRQFTDEQRTILDTITTGISRLRNRTHEWVNSGFVRMFGYAVDEVRGMPAAAFYADPAECQRVGEEGYAVLGTGKVYTTEALMKRKDGATFWCSLTGQAIDPQAPAAGSIWVLQDITERKRGEEAVRHSETLLRATLESVAESEQRFRTLFENMTEGVALHEVVYSQNGEAVDYRILDVNPAYGRHTGLTPERARGRLASEFYGSGSPPYLKEWAEVARSGKPSVFDVFFAPLQRHFHISAVSPKKGFFATVFEDITERIRTEAALRESENLLRRSQAVARVGSYYFDASTGNWISSLALDDLFGIGCDDSKDVACWLSLVHPDDRQEMQSHLRDHVLRQRQRFDKEYRIIRRSDGQERWVHGQGELELGPDGNVRRMIGTIQDITDRKRLESQLRQAQKMEAVGQLAGGVAHDFNNILAGMMLHLGLLRANPALDRHTQEALVDLEAQATRAGNLTRQLLLFGRRSVLEMRSLDLNEVIANLLKMLRRLLGEHIQIEFHGDESLPTVQGDCGMLEQVLMNLSVNARDAMPKGGRLVILTEKFETETELVTLEANRSAGRYVRISVSDTGCGMDEATLKRIFEPFFTTKEVGRGTGLGLATVYGIIKQHQGWIDVESRPGEGSTFRVWLPAEEGVSTPAPVGETSEPVVGGHETILLVEDDAAVRYMAGEYLRQLGYSVIEASNADEAVAQWRRQTPEIDLLITDMVMPGGTTGIELAEQIRREKAGVKVMVCSGYSAELQTDQLQRFSGAVYLPKPFVACVFGSVVRACLDSRPVPLPARRVD